MPPQTGLYDNFQWVKKNLKGKNRSSKYFACSKVGFGPFFYYVKQLKVMVFNNIVQL